MKLIDSGYLKFIFNCGTMKYETSNKHTLSSLTNIDNRYIHHTNYELLRMIESKVSVLDSSFKSEYRIGEICFGLSEKGKPSTLISPRPRINFIKSVNNEMVLYDEQHDDSMNAALNIFTFEEIMNAINDRSIVLEF